METNDMSARIIGAAAILHALVLLAILPASPWEFDEPLFFQALQRYDPLAHHPPPPGYPAFILFAQLVRFLMPSDFATLRAISAIASAVGFAFLALAIRNFTDDVRAGVLGAALFYASPAMLVHSTLPISDPGGLALLAASLFFWSAATRVAALRAPASAAALQNAFAFTAALTVGWRIQLCIFVVPFFLTALAMMKKRLLALGVFTITCLAWLAPLTIAVGGIEELIAFETGQGQYLASHDAAESRTGWTLPRIVFRFVGRAWGWEWTAAIVLVIAAIGFVTGMRKALVPVVAGGAVYIAAALLVMDPADGVRYALPFTLVAAMFAGIALARWRFAYVGAAILLIPFAVYTGPMLWQRRTTIAPPVAAAIHARATQQKGAVVLYELALWPHATYYLRQYDPHRVDDGLAKFYDRPEVPLFIYADGDTARRDAKVFRWRTSDAYEKLTRNHYRVASIIPVPPGRRYRIVRNVHATERTQEGFEWRWLTSPAELQLPRGNARRLTLVLGLSSFAPIDSNEVSVFVNDTLAARAPIRRGKPATIAVDVPGGAPIIRIEAARMFVPAEFPELRSGDRRALAVELYELAHAPRR
jgi:hypothetical protein